jgi:hypothetical protein
MFDNISYVFMFDGIWTAFGENGLGSVIDASWKSLGISGFFYTVLLQNWTFYEYTYLEHQAYFTSRIKSHLCSYIMLTDEKIFSYLLLFRRDCSIIFVFTCYFLS